MSDTIRILAIGDTVGNPGRTAIIKLYPRLKAQHNIDFFIANCENTAGGNGITPKLADELLLAGVDCITLGDHVWDQKEIKDYLNKQERIVRPVNYPVGVPGRGFVLLDGPAGSKIAVINALGRVFLHVESENPFTTIKSTIDQCRLHTNIIVVDIHAEATSEKQALFRFFDGQISLMFGTHTHVQTADEQISSKGTAFITDCGMTGPYDSVIGRVVDDVLYRFTTQMPGRMEVAQGDVRVCGVIVDVDKKTGRTVNITRHQWPYKEIS